MLFFSSRRRHTRCSRDWSSDACSSDLQQRGIVKLREGGAGDQVTNFGEGFVLAKTDTGTRDTHPDFSAGFFHHLGEGRSEEHTSELQSRLHLVCRLLLEKNKRSI